MSEFLHLAFNLVREYCCGFNSAGLLLALIQEKRGQNINFTCLKKRANNSAGLLLVFEKNVAKVLSK